MAEGEKDKNPLLIELVIANISKYLTFVDLKVCRGLNHLWKKTTNKTFLKRCPPLRIVYRLTEDDDYNTHLKLMTIAQFMEIYSDPNHPHPHAQLLRQYRNFVVYSFAEECIPVFYNFMTQVGPQMTSLELRSIKMLSNSQDLVDIVSSKYTPNLERLRLENLRRISDNYQNNDSKRMCVEGKENKRLRRLSVSAIDKIPWFDVLSRFPKLKGLSLKFLADHEIEEIAAGLVTIRKANEAKLKLAELKIAGASCRNGYLTGTERKARWQRILDLLKTANLPLEKISLDCDCTTCQISLGLIQHFGENLKCLTLKKFIPHPLPLMKALEEMRVKECGDLTFLTKVPNLKSLCFYPDAKYPQIRFPESFPSSLVSITKFKSGFSKKWSVTEMEQLRLWMPNVQHLEMRLNNTTFSWICQNFPNLKELAVEGEDLDDSGVVGDFDGALEFKDIRRPNITNLKALETFKMEGYPVLDKGLTEKSVFYGFSFMPKLSNLKINVKSELSAGAMLALHRGIKSVRVTVGSKAQSDVE